MFNTPLHPAVVHIPVGLAFLAPLLAVALAVAILRGWLPWRAWLALVLVQAVMLGGGIVAQRSGEGDGERVEKVVAESKVDAHEEVAEQFLWSIGLSLVLSLLVLPFHKRGGGRWALIGATIATFAVLGLGVRAGHSGGELVYLHGAAQVFTSGAAPAAPAKHPDKD